MNHQIKVRDALKADVEAIVAFNLKMAEETESRRLDPDILAAGVRAVFENPALGFYLVAEVGGDTAGSLLITFEWSDWRCGLFWWIQSVYVPPGFRRKGVFHALYHEVRKRAAQSENVCGCRLYVERENSPAQATYRQLGMSDTGYRVYEEMF